MITGAHNSDRLTFMEVSQTVLSNSAGDSARSSDIKPSESSLNSANKLQGTFAWPFCLELPKEVSIAPKATKGSPHTYRLPEPFFERHGRASIRYEICVRFVRGHFRSDDR